MELIREWWWIEWTCGGDENEDEEEKEYIHHRVKKKKKTRVISQIDIIAINIRYFLDFDLFLTCIMIIYAVR